MSALDLGEGSFEWVTWLAAWHAAGAKQVPVDAQSASAGPPASAQPYLMHCLLLRFSLPKWQIWSCIQWNTSYGLIHVRTSRLVPSYIYSCTGTYRCCH